MSDQYEAFRAFARAEIRAQRVEFKEELAKELRAEFKLLEGPPGKDGAPGSNGVDGKDGINGSDGKHGERGADGIATREELNEIVEKRFAEVQVRSLADVFEGVYDPSKLYPPGRLAVWDGQTWLSMTETRAAPAVSSDWKLIAKKGRDGRDARK